MAFSIDLFRRYSGSDHSLDLSNEQWRLFSTSIDGLAGNAQIASFFSGLSSRTGAINVAKDTVRPTGASWDNRGSLLLGDQAFTAGVTVDLADGQNFDEPIDRTIFHELVHAKYADAPTSITASFWAEERAVFLENTVFVAAFGGPERMGHTPGDQTGVSVSATSYLAGMSLTAETPTPATSVWTFSSGTTDITKDYFVPGSYVTASVAYQYDHYITIAVSSTSALVTPDGSIANDRLIAVLESSIVESAVDVLTLASDAQHSVIEMLGHINDAGLAWDERTGFSTGAFGQTQAVAISAERFTDNLNGTVRDYHGLADVGTASTSATIAIDASAHADGVLVFGGGGYDRNGVNGALSSDDLLGGAGDDILFAGAGAGNKANILAGGSGNDVLVGWSGRDDLRGGIGNDVFTSGAEGDRIDGGGGTDVISYASSIRGVTIDMSLRSSSSDTHTVVGLQTDGLDTHATGDVISGVEGIIGTSKKDKIIGDGSGLTLYGAGGNDDLYGGGGDILIGGEGLDKLYGKAGDVLIGGAGADEYHLTSTVLTDAEYQALSTREQRFYAEVEGATYTWVDGSIDDISTVSYWIPHVSIIGLEADDRIYVDGKLLTGSSVEVTNQYNSYYGDIVSVSEQNSWLEGTSFARGGNGFDGVEAYNFFTFDENGIPQTDDYGTIDLVHGTANSYPRGDRPTGNLQSVDKGITISIEDLQASGGGLKVDYKLMAHYDWSTWTMNGQYEVPTYSDEGLTYTNFHF